MEQGQVDRVGQVQFIGADVVAFQVGPGFRVDVLCDAGIDPGIDGPTSRADVEGMSTLPHLLHCGTIRIGKRDAE